jgi:hypothetical protein
LLKAVFEAGLRPLKALRDEGLITGPNRREVLTRFGHALEEFLAQALPVLTAAQSDVELRDALGAYTTEHELGPHRGIEALGGYLAGEQAASRVRPDVDPEAVAAMFVGGCFLRVSQGLIPVPKAVLPPLEDLVGALDAMLAPEGS